VVEYVDRFVDIGLTRVSLCDTTGMANPVGVKQLFDTVLARAGRRSYSRHNFHKHARYGIGQTHWPRIKQVVERFSTPLLEGWAVVRTRQAPPANVCTEDLVHMFHSMGIVTGR